MDPPELLSPSKDALFLDLPHDKRWEPLRPVIVSLRTGAHSFGDVWTIPKIAKFMKQHYNFDASPDAYSYRFRQWKVSKRVTKPEKESAIDALSRRSHVGSSTGRVILKQGEGSKTVDSKAIRRYLHQQKQHIDRIPLQPGVFSSWTRPYAAYVASIPCRPDMPSPFGTTAQTPENLTINSPEASSPGAARQDPSPTMHLVRQRELQQRTSFLLQGRTLELLGRCNIEDRSFIVNQLHDLHVQGIVMAKYWGRGPRTWSPGMVAALTTSTISDIAASPTGAFGTPQGHRSSQGRRSKDPTSEFPVPTSLCRWSIHVHKIGYDALPENDTERLHDQAELFDMEHPEAWPEWSSPTQERSFQNAVGESILNTPFTSGPSASPLLSQTLLSTALGNDTGSLAIDSIRLAIMAGNVALLDDLLDDLSDSRRSHGDFNEMVEAIYPFHLAASYLDGGSVCCGVFEALCRHPVLLRDLDRDGSGRTVLDKLFLSIIRSHTTVRPDQVFSHADGPSTFPAEEKDICGRWDADTPPVRALFAAGYTRIPTDWKHPFCHTAVQAICHASITIYAAPMSPYINATSGLFARNCFWCGEKLALGPLHLTVVAAFYLAEKGMAGETLLGILAVAVCLLSLGADSRQSVDICVEDFLSGAQHEACRHTKFSPAALMQAVPSSVVDRWTGECQTGWFCLFALLQLERDERQNNTHIGPEAMEMDVEASQSSEDTFEEMHLDESGRSSPCEVMEPEAAASSSSSKCDIRSGCGLYNYEGINVHREWLDIPCTSPQIGLVWACVQTELLTYRRLAHGDDWVSNNFSMEGLLAWLRGDSQSFRTSLVNGNMMKPHTKCGWFFPDSADFILPTAEDVSREYFMNMEDFRRSSFLPSSGLLESWLDSY